MENKIKGVYGGKFLPLHKGHMHCIFQAASQVDELYVVMYVNGEEEARCLAASEFPFGEDKLSPKVREMALRYELKDFPNVHIVVVDSNDLMTVEGYNSWENELYTAAQKVGHFDLIFSSEPHYTPTFDKVVPFAAHVLLDVERNYLTISSTMMRDGSMSAAEVYEWLPRGYQILVNKKILITGGESCGKSTLCRKLAKMYNTSYTVEYGREICERWGVSSPPKEMYNLMLCGQKVVEDEAITKGNRFVFCDTDAVITEMYAELYDGMFLELADPLMGNHDYALTLIISPSNEWVADEIRQHGSQEERERIHNQLVVVYEHYGHNVVELRGSYNDILKQAVHILENFAL